MPYSHLHFNFGSYHMHFKQAMEAADHYFTGLETSPFRFCMHKRPSKTEEEKVGDSEAAAGLKFNSVSCYAHTWSNLAVLFLLMTTVGHSSLPDLAEYDEGVVEQEALLAAQKCIERAIEAMPDGEGGEAYKNMNNVMR